MFAAMVKANARVILFGLLFVSLGAAAVNAQSRLEAARARERELDKAAARVDPSSRDADRIYRDAANATRERERLEREQGRPAETERPSGNRSAVERARQRERELDAAAERVRPDSVDADRTYRAAAEATRERERLERQEGQGSSGARSALDIARERERTLDEQARRVNPNSVDADRIYRDAANATRQRQMLERRERHQARRDTPLPYTSLEGTSHYYRARSYSFMARNPGRRDPYYRPFGEKYYNRYINEVSRTLTPSGQAFISKVGPAMQRLIEAKLQADPAAFARMERNPREFGRFVTEIHRHSYYDSGWDSLPSSDQWKILHAIDVRDLMSKSAMDAGVSLFPGLFGNNPRR